MTAFQLVAEAGKRGLTLKPAGDYLDVTPGRLCTRDFADKLRAHKPQLLALLQTRGISWIEVFSECIGETLFFCEDEDTKAALVDAGASQWSIYTKAELGTLVVQNRVKPFTDAELSKVHELKRTFNARINTSFNIAL
jgi:hypothetical protein